MIGRNSLRDIQLTQVQNNLAGHISEATLGHFKLTPSKAAAGDLPVDKPRKPRNDKAKAGNNPVTPPTQPTVPRNNANIVTPPTPPAGRVKYCNFFLSTAGCYRGSSCTRSHTIPPRGDPVRELIKKYMAERNLVLSPAFLRGE